MHNHTAEILAAIQVNTDERLTCRETGCDLTLGAHVRALREEAEEEEKHGNHDRPTSLLYCDFVIGTTGLSIVVWTKHELVL